MFTRIVNFTGVQDIDEGVRYIRETAAPLLRQQVGFRGASASADRSGGLLSVLTIWATEADRDASESALGKAREELRRSIGGHVDVDRYELLVTEVVSPLTVGAVVLVQRVSMDPGAVDGNVAYFSSEVVPHMKAQPGFLAVHNMIDRGSGAGLVGTVWTDSASMEAAEREAEGRREVAVAERGLTFGEQSRREIVFVDMP
jgi:heme-degrading monooxygenase HmoA